MAKIRFRKTFNLGGGVKITASKKGLGASIGVKGARIGRGADGRTRISGSIPGTGLSAQHTLGSGKRRTAQPRAARAPLTEADLEGFRQKNPPVLWFGRPWWVWVLAFFAVVWLLNLLAGGGS